MMPFALIGFVNFISCFDSSVSILPWAKALFKGIHSPLDEHDTTAISTALQFIAIVVFMILVPYTGKRIPTLASLAIGSIANFVVALNIIFAQDSEQVNWVSTIGVLIAVGSSFLGIRQLPWMLLGELFPTDVRSIMVGILACGAYICADIAIKSYVYTKQMLNLPGTFLFFACDNFIGLIVLYFVMLETEGKSLAEIEKHFSGRKVDKNKSVSRKGS